MLLEEENAKLTVAAAWCFERLLKDGAVILQCTFRTQLTIDI